MTYQYQDCTNDKYFNGDQIKVRVFLNDRSIGWISQGDTPNAWKLSGQTRPEMDAPVFNEIARGDLGLAKQRFEFLTGGTS